MYFFEAISHRWFSVPTVYCYLLIAGCHNSYHSKLCVRKCSSSSKWKQSKLKLVYVIAFYYTPKYIWLKVQVEIIRLLVKSVASVSSEVVEKWEHVISP